MSFKSITGAVAVAAALSLPSVVSAQGAQGFVQIGPSDYGYADDGIGIKLGLDFAPNLNGVRGLGLTAFYAHTESDENYFGRRWNHDAHSFAFGPTYTYSFPGTKFSVQGRGFLELSHVRWDSPCCRHSDTDLDVGIGIGGQYALDGKYAIRFDYDMLGVGADLLSIGLGFKF